MSPSGLSHRGWGSNCRPLISARVTQVYPTEACVYFTYAIYVKGVPAAAEMFAEIEHSMREVILAEGGSISHHHGVGKIRQPFVEQFCSPQTVAAMQAVKQQLDPKNVFGIRNNVFE